MHPEGYGVFYFTPGTALRFCCTAYQPGAAAKFNEEVRKALQHVRAVLEAEAPP